jgi:hypothetical protein
MKIGVLVLLMGLVGLTAACSTGPSKPASATAATAKVDESTDGVICTYEKPTGSFLKEKKCTTAAEREAARQHNSLMDVRNQRDSGVP